MRDSLRMQKAAATGVDQLCEAKEVDAALDAGSQQQQRDEAARRWSQAFSQGLGLGTE